MFLPYIYFIIRRFKKGKLKEKNLENRLNLLLLTECRTHGELFKESEK